MRGLFAPIPFKLPPVAGLDDAEQVLLARLVNVWVKKKPGNETRQAYVDMKAVSKNLNLAFPDDVLADIQVVVGWPEKAVYSLANLCMWDGVVAPSGSEDPFELADVLRENRFETELPQAIASALTHSAAFISTTLGDASVGEPAVMVMAHSAAWSAAIWDRRARAISAGLLIHSVDTLGRPTEMTLLTGTEHVSCVKGASGWAVAFRAPHGLGRVPLEPLAYRPALDRPFGRSRVSRAVMTITDRAVRAALRMDISSELFTAPGLIIRGITQEQWADIAGNWSWRMGNVKGLTRDEDGELPQLDVLPQQSMQPYVEQLRQLAAEFAGVTSLPLSSLGVIHDNPSSAEAMLAAKDELVTEATNTTRDFGHSLARIYQNIVMLRDGLGVEDLPRDLKLVSTKWRNPAMPSIVSQSDAMVKQIAAIPALADTDVALEQLGYSQADIIRMRAQMRRAAAAGALAGLLAEDTEHGAR